MKQNSISEPIESELGPVRKVPKKRGFSAVRFDRDFMKKVSRLAEKANKKPLGRKVTPKAILENLLYLADDSLLERVVKKAQEDSLSHSDKRESFLKDRLAKFNGSKEQLELKMMEIFDQYLSQNSV